MRHASLDKNVFLYILKSLIQVCVLYHWIGETSVIFFYVLFVSLLYLDTEISPFYQNGGRPLVSIWCLSLNRRLA